MPPAIYRPEDGPHDNYLFSETSDEYLDAISNFYSSPQEAKRYGTELEHENVERDTDQSVDKIQQDCSVSLLRSEDSHHATPITENSRGHSSSESDLEIAEDGLEHNQEITETILSKAPVGRQLKYVEPAQLIYPKSRYKHVFSDENESFEPHDSRESAIDERTAVRELLEEMDRITISDHKAYGGIESGLISTQNQGFLQVELTDFTIYLPPSSHHHPYEMRPLDHLANKIGSREFLFDGILHIGHERRYVEGVPFKICPVGNYGEEHHCVADQIWIQSYFNEDTDIFYHLSSPSPEYSRFYTGFLWIADLAKHFVDYCISSLKSRNLVSIHDFRHKFSAWMNEKHGMSAEFQTWYRKYQSSDFRQAVNQNIRFLHKESIGVDEKTRVHSIWAELLHRNSIPKHPIRNERTVVTPYVYECFSHMRFGKHLKSVIPDKDVEVRRISQGHSLQLTIDENFGQEKAGNSPSGSISKENRVEKIPGNGTRTDEENLQQRRDKVKAVQIGDVVSVAVDGAGSFWKDEVTQWKTADDCWYLLVQGVHTEADGHHTFDGLWLYKPSDTICAKMKYPYNNELFLSDHCTCPCGREDEENIIDIVNVIWHGTPCIRSQDLYIRQTYLDGERFVTLDDSHKRCKHLKFHGKDPQQDLAVNYRPGETVLVESRKIPRRKCKNEVEPYEVVENIHDGLKHYVLVRRLLRRAEFDGRISCAPNELVYTEKLDKVLAKSILHRCLVRFYSEEDARKKTIPAPYNRNGTGNAFFITTKLVDENQAQRLEPIQENDQQSLVQGFDPLKVSSSRLLRGLDLYCGGGNFGRGLEEGGSVHQEWAVDLAENAIHTYHANLTDPRSCKLFHGSVDDLLFEAFQGNPKRSTLIPMPGDVEFISAGSPCQGFSLLNARKNNEKGLKNQSLVASVAAYVDFYRPKYGLLENVLNMAQKGRGRDQDVLSQLICAIVGMGYQTQVFVLDAWSCGSPQSRSRLFLSFAAPGYEPIQHPELSHSHPPSIKSVSVGLKANGESFGSRKFGPTPFRFVSAGKAVADLPRIGDAHTYQCISHPDHILARTPKEEDQQRIACIPVTPRGMTFSKTWMDGQGTMTNAERALFPSTTKKGEVRANVMQNSRAWGRVHPDFLFSTITVTMSPEDSRTGTCIHWDQNRYLSVMEARRAQSFLDDEVLVGLPRDQWKIVGNSVARTVSLALGLKVREAWEKRPAEGLEKSLETKSESTSGIPRTKTNHEQKSNGSLGHLLQKPQILSPLLDTSDDNNTESETLSRDEMVASISSASSMQSKNTSKLSKRNSSDSDEPGSRPGKATKLSVFAHTPALTKDQETSKFQVRVELPSVSPSSMGERQATGSGPSGMPAESSRVSSVEKQSVMSTSNRQRVVAQPENNKTATRTLSSASSHSRVLNKKLELVQNQKRAQSSTSSSEDSEDEDEKEEISSPPSPQSHPTRSLAIRSPESKKRQIPAAEQSVISLLSSDEEEEEDEPIHKFPSRQARRNPPAPIPAPASRAAPIQYNGIFNSFIQAKHHMANQSR